MGFTLGCAAVLYEQRLHPRLLIGPEDVLALRGRIQAGDGKRIMDAMRESAKPMVAQILQTDNMVERLLEEGPKRAKKGDSLVMGGAMGKSVLPLDMPAMVGLLDEDADAIEAVRRVLAALPFAEKQYGKTGYMRFSNSFTRCIPLAYDLIAPYLSDEERLSFGHYAADCLVRQTLDLRRSKFYKCAGQNINVDETCCTALIALLAVRNDPGVPDLESELAELVSFLAAALHTVMGPQGYPEEDMGYGTTMLGAMIYSVEATRRAGLYDAYTDCPRLSRFGHAILHMIQPWGERLCNIGDNFGQFPDRGVILPRLATEMHDPTLLWLLSTFSSKDDQIDDKGKFLSNVQLSNGLYTSADAFAPAVLDELQAPVHPLDAGTPTRFLDTGRGISFSRDGWHADATFVSFDGSQRSPAAQGHAHASGGHFTLSALGEYFAIPTGRYNMEQDEHNLVLIDGKSGRTTNNSWQMVFHHANLIDDQPGDFVDFAAVDSSHQHDCYWARRYFGFVKGHGVPGYAWTVEDINKANDWAEYWWTLNTHYNNTIEVGEQSATIHGCRHGNCLDVHFAILAPHEFPKPHTLALAQDLKLCNSTTYLGDVQETAKRYINPDGYYPPEQTVLVRPRLIAKVGGYNGRFMSLMLPRVKDEAPAVVERLEAVDNSLAVRITFAEVEDILIFAYEHNLLEAADVKGRGQWCVVRRSRATGEVLAHALGHGTSLAVAGKTLEGRQFVEA